MEGWVERLVEGEWMGGGGAQQVMGTRGMLRVRVKEQSRQQHMNGMIHEKTLWV